MFYIMIHVSIKNMYMLKRVLRKLIMWRKLHFVRNIRNYILLEIKDIFFDNLSRYIYHQYQKVNITSSQAVYNLLDCIH